MSAAVTYAVPAGVGHVLDGDVVALARFGSEQRLVLRGTAADVWLLAFEGLDHAALVDRLQERFDGDPALIASSVADVLDELVGAGLLTRRGAP